MIKMYSAALYRKLMQVFYCIEFFFPKLCFVVNTRAAGETVQHLVFAKTSTINKNN